MGNRAKKRGFTLTEVLVVMGIVSLLFSVIMPALGHTRKLASRIGCGANLRTVGLALHLYEQDMASLPPQYDRWGPSTETYRTQFMEPWISYVAFHNDVRDDQGRMLPLQLAYLVRSGILDVSEALYCPGQPNYDDHEPFTHDYYTQDGQGWGTWLPTRANGRPDDKVRTSYHYWLSDQRTLTRLSRRPVVFDNIQHWNSVAHQRRQVPQGINALFGDGHVKFQNQQDLFDLELWNGGPAAGMWDGPGNDRTLFRAILDRIEP